MIVRSTKSLRNLILSSTALAVIGIAPAGAWADTSPIEQSITISQTSVPENAITLGEGDGPDFVVVLSNSGTTSEANAASGGNTGAQVEVSGAAIVSGYIQQSIESSQLAGLRNAIAISSDDAGSVIAVLANAGSLTAANAMEATEKAAQMNVSPAGIVSGSIAQSEEVDQQAGLWNEIDIAVGSADGITAVLSNFMDVQAANAAQTSEQASQTNVSDGDIASGDIEQTAELDQQAGMWNAVRIAADSADGITAVLDNSMDALADNAAETSQQASQANVSSSDIASGDIEQTAELDQQAGMWNAVRIAADSADGITAVLAASGSTAFANAAQASQEAVQSNVAGVELASGDILQDVAITQLAETLNLVEISVGGSGGITAVIATESDGSAANAAAVEQSADQDNVSSGDLSTGDISQSAVLRQDAGLWNRMVIDSDGNSAITGVIANSGELDAANAADLDQEATQGNVSSGMVDSGGISQDASVEQFAGIRNEMNIASTGGITTDGEAITATIANDVDLKASNAASISQKGTEANISSQDISTGDIEQSATVRQFAGIRNDVEITNSGAIDAGDGGIVAVITNSGELNTSNFSDIKQDAGQANVSAGDVDTGDIDQQASSDQYGGVWSRIGISNTGSIVSGGNGIVAIISNDVVESQIAVASISQAGDQANIAAGSLNEGDVSRTSTLTQRIDIQSEIELSNSGSIYAGRTGLVGIISGGFGSITMNNSGILISEEGQALLFSGGTEHTLNLMAPAFIGGAMDLGGSAEVNITTGRSHSVLWTFDGDIEGGAPNVSGPVPYFYNPDSKTFATIDPTVFSAAYDTLANVTGMASATIQRRLDGGLSAVSLSSGAYASYNASAEPQVAAADTGEGVAVPVADVAPLAPTSGAWLSVSAAGSSRDADGPLFGTDGEYWNAALGYDWQYNGEDRFGVMAGWFHGETTSDSPYVRSYSGEAEGFFAGLYGRSYMGDVFLDYGVTGGGLSHDDKRFVNDNLAYLGRSSADADYDSFWISPEIALGLSRQLSHGFELIPSIRLRYAAQWIDGYTEEGARANAEVDSRQIALGEGRAEFAARQTMDFGTITGRIGLLGRTPFGEDSVDVTLIGQAEAIPTFQDSEAAGYAALDLNLHPTDSLRLDIGGQVVRGADFTEYGGTLQLTYAF